MSGVMRAVTTGTKEGEFTEIVKGVGAAELVLTRGGPKWKTVPTEP